MNDIPTSPKTMTPPAFMATTRQKIMLMHQGITDTRLYEKPSRTQTALNAIGDMTRGMLALAKKD